MSRMEDSFIDLTVTSPPYDKLRDYGGYVFDFNKTGRKLYNLLKPGGVCVWVVGDETKNGSESGTSFRHALHFMYFGFKLHDTMIYLKDGFAFPESIRYQQIFEYMFIFGKGAPATFNPIKIYAKGVGKKMRTKRQPNGSIHRGEYNVGTGCPRPNVWKIKPDQ